MKKLFFSVVVMVIAAGFANNANAQASTNTANASVNAVVATSGSFTKQLDLNYGSFTVSGAGTFELTPAGSPTISGGLQIAGSTPSSAKFHIIGTSGQNVHITLPAVGYQITNTSDAAEKMTITSWACDKGTGTWALSVAGTGDVYVGGILSFSATQKPGSYQNATGFVVTCDFE